MNRPIISIFACICLLWLRVSCSLETAMVISLIKYGNTNPETDFKVTKYGNSTLKNQFAEPKTLTEVGKRQMFLMGRYYKLKYKSLFNGDLLSNDVNVISSDTSRSVTAAHAFILGFTEQTAVLETNNLDKRLQPCFKSANQSELIVNPGFETPLPPGWNTITIQATSVENDTLLNLNSKEVCPNRNILLTKKEKARLSTYMNVEAELRKVAEIYGVNASDIDFSDLEMCTKIFSLIESDYYRRSDPIISKSGEYAELYDKIEKCSDASLISLYGNYQDIVAAGSPIFVNITNTIKDFVERDSPIPDTVFTVKNRRMHIYSCHKKSFFPAMVIFGMSSIQCVENRFKGLPMPENENCFEFPNPAIHMAIELLRERATQSNSKHEYFIRVLYKDAPFKLPGMSQDTIPLKEFLSFIKRSINTEWARDCGLYLPDVPQKPTESWAILLVASNGLLLIIIITAFWLMWTRTSKQKPVDDLEDPLNFSINDK